MEEVALVQELLGQVELFTVIISGEEEVAVRPQQEVLQCMEAEVAVATILVLVVLQFLEEMEVDSVQQARLKEVVEGRLQQGAWDMSALLLSRSNGRTDD
jgi:hypothetical protein